MSAPHFCTYFDERYLVRGIALYDSLRKQLPDFTLWVLCLSADCHAALRQLALPQVRLVTMEMLEAADRELKATEPTRSRYEYFLTCTPCLMRYLLTAEQGIEALHYLDADLFFFADPQVLIRDFEQASIAITPHRFPARYHQKLSVCGEYNVGWVSIRADTQGMACVGWWRERCLEWCFDRIEPGRCGDQKYLDEFPHQFQRVQVIRHVGANLAPWNISNHRVWQAADCTVQVDDMGLLFFHFSGLRRLGQRWYVNNQRVYGRLSAASRRLVYQPYLRELAEIESRLAAAGIAARRLHAQPKQMSLRGTLRKAYDHTLGLVVAAVAGNLIRL